MASNFFGRVGVFVLAALIAGGSAKAQQSAVPRLSARDQIKITVWGVDELTRQYSIDVEGVLDFPWIGAKLKVAGLTPHELETELAKRLRDGGFLVNPQVSIDFQETANKRVTVSGAVTTQGAITFAGQISVLDAVIRAGGRRPEASDEVLVVRGDEQLAVNLRELEAGNLRGNILLQDGDQVFVKKAQQVFISGEVRAPNGYSIETGTNLRQALALAGGVTEKGSTRGIKILRPFPGKEKPVEVKAVTMETLVKPGDTIIVNARIF
ncbi:MAG: polysaccharide biosynthesis/export family protein [Vicinamibacterales bacterium]